MRRILGWMTVVVLFCATGCATGMGMAATGQEQPDPRLSEAQTAFEKAKKLLKSGKYAEGITQTEQALELRKAVLGDSHLEVAESLNLLGALYGMQGDPTRAEQFFQRTLTIREAALGGQHLLVAETLNNLANLYHEQGLNNQAEPLFKRALAIWEVALGKQHPQVAETLNNLANLYTQQELYKRAKPLYERALDIWEWALSPDHPVVAPTLCNLAYLYTQQGLYNRAEPLLERALAIRQAAFGKRHPKVAQTLKRLANLYSRQGLYSQAEPLVERALAIEEAALGPQHPDVARTLGNLAYLFMKQGLYNRAEPLLKRALSILEATLGKQHPFVACMLNSLAVLYSQQGLYSRAEPLYEHALTLREAVLGKQHPTVAVSLTGLANLYSQQGLYSRAEPLYERALAIEEAALGKQHPQVAETLNNLALLYSRQGLYSRAEPLYERALAIRDSAHGQQHLEVSTSLLHNLAILYTQQGLYSRAEPLYERALALREAILGPQHFEVAHSLQGLAHMHRQQGSYSRAAPLVERALAVLEATRGPQHPDVAQSLRDLARLRLVQNQHVQAIPLLTRAFSISERHLRQEALAFSESRLTSVLRHLRSEEDFLYSLLRAHPGDVHIRRLALSAVLLRKGRSVEETTSTSRTIYLGLGEEDRSTFEQLRGLRTQLAMLSHQGPGPLSPSDYQQRLKSLAEQGDALETQLARHSAPLRALTTLPGPEQIVERVAAALPRDSALIEFVAYRDSPVVPKPGTLQSPSELRYLALVLLPDATLRTLDLGPAAAMDQAASAFRDALASGDAAWQAPAQALHSLAFLSLRPLLGDVRRLFLAPDGQLNLVPFAALHDGQGLLVDSFHFTYLTSGRDLLPRPQDIAPPHSLVVLADPDFGAMPASASDAQQQPPALALRSSSTERFFSTHRTGLAQRTWEPLPGTRQEAQAIQRLLPQAQLFLGADASKQRLLSLPPPGVLHIATHGFFLEDSASASPKASRAVGHVGALSGASSSQHLPDPLLRSGLVLSGAASQEPLSPDTSLATALELAGLSLWGTELVVLSACETGRGDIKVGQGVYGLRRAFLAAGAETVVSSLWKVNDDTTHQLMQAYYRHLLAGTPRASALHEAMLELRKTHPHPYAWAPFIALGRDAPLRSLAPLPKAQSGL